MLNSEDQRGGQRPSRVRQVKPTAIGCGLSCQPLPHELGACPCKVTSATRVPPIRPIAKPTRNKVTYTKCAAPAKEGFETNLGRGDNGLEDKQRD